jgi:cyanophycin synthetase
VMETSEINVIREGLAFDHCQIAVVTNLGSGDHMGERYVDDRSLVAKAVRAPVDVVLPDGVAVLNADDADVAAMAEKCRGRVVYFAGDADARPMQDAIARGEDAVFVTAGKVVVAHAGQIVNLLDLAPLHEAHPVALPVLLGDVMAAAATGIALGLMPSHLRQGIEHGLRDPGYALYTDGQRRALVTPVSNPSSLAAWLPVLTEAFSMPRHAILEVAPDWRQEDAKAIEALLTGFASVSLARSATASEKHDHLLEIIQHPKLFRENSLASAVDRISATSGASDFMFVMPSKRSGADLADTHLRQRNMVRLDIPDLAAVVKPT